MSSKTNTQLFGRRLCTEGFHLSQYVSQPANHWFEDVLDTPIEADSPLKDRTSRSDLDITDGPSKSYESNWQDEELPGTGTVVAILDTGIQYDHLAFSNHVVAFKDKVIEHRNFLNPEDECEDYNGHGTECAGMACGLSFKGIGERQSGGEVFYQFNSPAPGARLMVCKIGHDEKDDKQASLKATVDALKYIVSYNKIHTNADSKVDIISISFSYDTFDKQLAMAIQEAISTDIIVVCCASNDGMRTQNPISYPGRLGHVLCIGACDQYGQPAKFSSVGKEVDFVELGEGVWVPSVGYRNDEVKVLDGTSYSTPAVAGLICRLLQDLRRLSVTYHYPDLYDDMHNIWCMRELLKSMSTVRGHHDTARGYGRLEPKEYFKKGDQERIRVCKEILGMS